MQQSTFISRLALHWLGEKLGVLGLYHQIHTPAGKSNFAAHIHISAGKSWNRGRHFGRTLNIKSGFAITPYSNCHGLDAWRLPLDWSVPSEGKDCYLSSAWLSFLRLSVVWRSQTKASFAFGFIQIGRFPLLFPVMYPSPFLPLSCTFPCKG